MWSSTELRLAGAPALVTADELRRRGVDSDVARRAVAAGRWQEAVPGTWWRGPELPRTVLRSAAVRAGGAGALLTGADACQAYGMRDVPPDALVLVLLPHDVRRRLGSRVRVIRSHRMPESYVLAGVRTAEPAAAVEAAGRACTDLRAVRALVTAAVGDGWCTAAELHDRLAIGASAGSALLRRAVGDAARGARSAPEAEVAAVLDVLVRRGTLPPFLLNVQVRVDGVLLGCVDGYVPGRGVGWEVDSHRHHGSPDDLDRTLLRHAAFADAGIRLEHVTPRRFRQDPTAWARGLAGLAAQGRTEPAGLELLPLAAAPLRPAA